MADRRTTSPSVPRQRYAPCARCGKTMWRGKGSRPPGQGVCLECRRQSPEYQARVTKVKWTPDIRVCPTCGRQFEQHRHHQRYCNPGCRPGRSGVKTKTTTERGYGQAHQQERRKWKPIVDAGQAVCHAKTCVMRSRAIQPGEEWDLGHTEDRTAWTGPEHRRCNRREGARRGNAARGASDSPKLTLWWQP